ncbi:hypothetical protein CF326_g7548 [Tilletia indica]|nr:hypothetical protein CF326_g7548 [Tilletia indica]
MTLTESLVTRLRRGAADTSITEMLSQVPHSNCAIYVSSSPFQKAASAEWHHLSLPHSSYELVMPSLSTRTDCPWPAAVPHPVQGVTSALTDCHDSVQDTKTKTSQTQISSGSALGSDPETTPQPPLSRSTSSSSPTNHTSALGFVFATQHTAVLPLSLSHPPNLSQQLSSSSQPLGYSNSLKFTPVLSCMYLESLKRLSFHHTSTISFDIFEPSSSQSAYTFPIPHFPSLRLERLESGS